MKVIKMIIKDKIPMICNIISILLIVAFIVKTIVDYMQYITSFTSAPFSVCIGVNAVFMIIPAAVIFVVGYIVKKKWRK